MNVWFILVFLVKLAYSIRSDEYKCGQKLKSSVSSATGTSANEWPWLVSLHFLPSKEYFCGGTIVSEYHVLTAAHCVDHKGEGRLDPDQILVYLGKHNLSSSDETYEWFHPYQILVHPDWEDSGNRFDADIAILIVAVPIPFSKTIAPVCLWTELAEEEDYTGTVVGWGEFGSLKKPDVPHQLQVQRVTSAKCYEDFHIIASIASSRTFCAGAVTENNVPCTGFSGGGFFIEENGVWFIQGIVSSALVSQSSKRCDASKYSLFTKVNEFLSWVNIRSYNHRVVFICDTIPEFDQYKLIKTTCLTKGLSVLQPSGQATVSGKKSAVVVKGLRILKEDVVYFPNGFGALFPELTKIEVTDSKLRFIHRKNFRNMENVENLLIESNPILNVPNDAFADLKSLRQLVISDCKLMRLHRNLFASNPSLVFLSLRKNQLETLPSDLLRNNVKLEMFLITDNRIKFIDDELFANLPKLRNIDFSQNYIQNISANAFRDLKSLNRIVLDYNRLKRFYVDTFSNNLDLDFFSVSYNQIKTFANGIFRNNLKLKTLLLDQNKVNHVHESLAETLANLERLSLNGMFIANLPADIFSTPTKLEYLSIQTNELTDLNKDLLRNNPKLYSFRADFNRIKQLDSTFFRNNSKLTTITLSNNRINELAECLFCNLKLLTIVDLSFNYIENISADIFNGSSFLKLLQLNENHLHVFSRVSIVNNLPKTKVILSSGVKYSEEEKLVVNNQTVTRDEITNKEVTRVDPYRCGRKLKSVGLVVNGTTAEANEWPWLASLVRTPSKEYFCGGSIVSQHHVLTAAHCLHDKYRKQNVLKPDEFLVYLGKHNLSALEKHSAWFHPQEVLVHPDWGNDNVRFDADLAVVVSDAQFPFSPTIAPVCLWTELEEDGNYFGTVVGWGASEKTGLTGHTDVPYEVLVQRVPSAKCYEHQFKIAQIGSSRSFCAGGVNEYSGPCNGDSGTGNFVEQNGIWYLQGIVSSTTMTRTRTCDVSKFTLYTKINEFLSWINLKNKVYEVRLRGHLDVASDDIKFLTFNTVRLTTSQPSGKVVLDWENSALKVDRVRIIDQNVIYLPNGFGKIFPTIKHFQILQSKLRFIERENFYHMANLVSLTIHMNPIKNIPGDAFAEMTNLSNLNITNNQLVTLPGNLLANNTHLLSFNLTTNLIESLPHDLFRYNLELETLDLTHNQLKFISEELFANLQKLYEVLLSYNRIQSISPELFSFCTNLKIAKLDSNRIKGFHIDTFERNKELSDLYFEYNLLDNLPGRLFRNNLNLESISLQANNIKNFSNTLFDGLQKIFAINLDRMNIKNIPFAFFFALSGLRILRLNDNLLEALHKDLLSKNENLGFFHAKFNRIEDLDPNFFQNNLKIWSIGLSNNQLSILSAELFKNLVNLKYLELAFNLIETIEFGAFSDLSALERLNMKDNNLRTLNESQLSNLTNLKMLDMSSNLIEYLHFGLFKNNRKLVSIIFNNNRLKRVDIAFDPKRPYEHLLFIGNECVNAGDFGRSLNINKAEIVGKIVGNCSELNNHDLKAFKSDRTSTLQLYPMFRLRPSSGA